MKKIFMHIGLPKTGTSSIQVFLANNISKLEKYNYLYPEIESLDKAKKGEITSGNMGYISRSLLPEFHGEFPNGSDYKKELRKLYEIIEVSKFENILLSSEFICVLPPTSLFNLAETLSKYEVKIVIYLRAQEQFIQSVYAQRVKRHQETRTALEFTNFLIEKDPNIDYYALLGKFSDVFGKDNLIIRIYEKEQLVNGDLIEDYLCAVGIDNPSDFDIDKKGVNKTHNNYIISIKRIINKHFSSKLGYKISDLMARIEFNQYFKDKRLIGKKIMKKIVDKFKESNSKVAIEYLGRKDGKLFKRHY